MSMKILNIIVTILMCGSTALNVYVLANNYKQQSKQLAVCSAQLSAVTKVVNHTDTSHVSPHKKIVKGEWKIGNQKR